MGKHRKTLKISLRGNKAQKQRARELLDTIPLLEARPEAEARLKIQDLIDEYDLKAAILVNGNSVWSKKRIIRNLKRILKRGTLYDENKPIYTPVGSMLRLPNGAAPILSKYFYQFLHLQCGSIAHYNIHGWIHHYPTIDSLKKFFKSNEFGKKVSEWIPEWYADARRIVEEIEQLLFPFQTYMKSRKTN